MPSRLEKCQILTQDEEKERQTLKCNICRALVLSTLFNFSSLTPFYDNSFENKNIKIGRVLWACECRYLYTDSLAHE